MRDDFKVPLSVDELVEIAKSLKMWERKLFDKHGDWTALSQCVESIEIHRPEQPGKVIGHFVLNGAGWLGFRPNRPNRPEGE